MKLRSMLLLSLAIGLIGCQPAAEPPSAPVDADAPPRVTLMTYNVENMFDNRDDAGKNDNTYFPSERKQHQEHKDQCATIAVEKWRNECLHWDWSDDVVNTKLAAVAGAILQVNDGRGPDIVALQEVENAHILNRLRTEHLAAADYLPAILIEGHDIRGIDVAFLSRLPLVGDPVLHALPAEGIDRQRYDDTRGVLEATFRLPDGELLTGYAVHFPAPFHPTMLRVVAYNHLNGLLAGLPDGRMAFAAGDFNTTALEDQQQRMLDRLVRPHWTVVHEQGCTECLGTHYYSAGDAWSYLDMIIWSDGANRGADATWEIVPGSIHVAVDAPGQMLPNGTPASFEMPGATGISDHLPLHVDIAPK